MQRVDNVLASYQQKNYTAVWDKVKAKSYQIPHDAHALQHAKSQKIILSNVSLTFLNLTLCSYYTVTFLQFDP